MIEEEEYIVEDKSSLQLNNNKDSEEKSKADKRLGVFWDRNLMNLSSKWRKLTIE